MILHQAALQCAMNDAESRTIELHDLVAKANPPAEYFLEQSMTFGPHKYSNHLNLPSRVKAGANLPPAVTDRHHYSDSTDESKNPPHKSVPQRLLYENQTIRSSWTIITTIIGSLYYQCILIETRGVRKKKSQPSTPPSKGAIWKVKIIPASYLASTGLEMTLSNVSSSATSLGFSPGQSLRFFPVVPATSSIFWACQSGNYEQMVTIFDDGLASPFDTTWDGWTLLHVSELQIYKHD